MIDLKKILVGVDFSETSRTAVNYAAELAKAFGSEVVLGHVVEDADWLSHLPPGDEGYYPPNLPEMLEQRGREEGEKLRTECGLADVRLELRRGKPFLELVNLARDEEADLIIIGTHGRGAVAQMLLGSVAEKVVRKAPCPVLTVRTGEHEFVHP